ncbi:substrate-binding domain-containing protein [Verrucomicrobiaceae bacterium 227]
MTRRLKIESISEQVAHFLADDLRSGTWIETLPGIRALAGHYQVNHKTIERALRILELKGSIEPAEPRKPRRITTGAEITHRKVKNLLLLHPADLFDADTSILFRHRLAHSWTKHFESYSLVSIEAALLRSPGKILDRLIRQHNADAIALYNMPLKWGLEALERRPVYFAGGGTPADRKVSGFALSFRNELSKAYQTLRNHGHQRTLLLYDAALGGMRELALQLPESPGILDALVGAPADYVLPLPSMDPDGYLRMWHRELPRLKATAVITTAACAIPSLYSYCHQMGKRIPEDLSIICVDYVKELEWLSPKPQMLRYDYDAHLRHFESWMRGGLQNLGTKLTSLVWDRSAGSVGKAAD